MELGFCMLGGPTFKHQHSQPFEEWYLEALEGEPTYTVDSHRSLQELHGFNLLQLFCSLLFGQGISYMISKSDYGPTQRLIAVVTNHLASYQPIYVLGSLLPPGCRVWGLRSPWAGAGVFKHKGVTSGEPHGIIICHRLCFGTPNATRDKEDVGPDIPHA